MISFILFQLGWFAAVYWHNNTAGVLCILLSFINFYVLNNTSSRLLLISIFIAIIGGLNDYILLQLNIISFPGQEYFIFPLWLLSLWLLLTSAFEKSFAWIFRLNIMFQALLSGIGGGLSYVAGNQIGAISYNFTPFPGLAFHFINWAILFPILLKIYQKLK